ncbi:MAG TPA: zinc ABC transporter substrate-binding protein [Syntrophorhabdaceae bacterium]|nr:zinc ABC transporter substrate-binding protein [Syntrophorhabdaceae bacterium]
MKKAIIILTVFLSIIGILSYTSQKGLTSERKYLIITSDTLLANMVSSLLPKERYSVEAILPPDQCPGHYDIKIKDMEKIKHSELIVSFRDMPFLNNSAFNEKTRIFVDSKGHNWMSPNHYEHGLKMISNILINHFKQDALTIERLKDKEMKRLKEATINLKRLIKDNGLLGKKVIASSMQKEPLEWMGFKVVAEYGRQESLSTKDIVRLTKIEKKGEVILVVDNLQSGPNVGKSIAEAIGVPHVVLTNFPSEKGYIETLKENVLTIINALNKR